MAEFLSVASLPFLLAAMGAISACGALTDASGGADYRRFLRDQANRLIGG